MSADRVNELRELLRTHRPDTPDIYPPVREAVARQDAAMIAHREPANDLRREQNVLEESLGKVLDVEAGLPEILNADE